MVQGCRPTAAKAESVLTPRGEEDLDGRVLQQVAPGEDGPDLCEVPFAVDVVTVPQHL